MRLLLRSAGDHLKCFTTLVTYTFDRWIPASVRAWSKSLPAGPTNGCPERSSTFPGCSPTNMIAARAGPSPKTVCVALFHRSHALQVRAASLSAGSELLGLGRGIFTATQFHGESSWRVNFMANQGLAFSMRHSGLHVVRIIGIGLPHGDIWILRRIVRFTDRRRGRFSWCAKVVQREARGVH